MTILTVRGLDPSVQARLRERAARHGRSMEAEARALLSDAVLREEDDPVDLVAIIHGHFADAPVELDLPELDLPELDLPERAEYQRPIDLTS